MQQARRLGRQKRLPSCDEIRLLLQGDPGAPLCHRLSLLRCWSRHCRRPSREYPLPQWTCERQPSEAALRICPEAGSQPSRRLCRCLLYHADCVRPQV